MLKLPKTTSTQKVLRLPELFISARRRRGGHSTYPPPIPPPPLKKLNISNIGITGKRSGEEKVYTFNPLTFIDSGVTREMGTVTPHPP